MIRPRATSFRPGGLAATTRLAALFIAPGIAGHADKAAPRPMEPIGILDWRTIGPAAISDDGTWVMYRYSPVQGDTSIVVRATSGDKGGSGAGGGGSATNGSGGSSSGKPN